MAFAYTFFTNVESQDDLVDAISFPNYKFQITSNNLVVLDENEDLSSFEAAESSDADSFYETAAQHFLYKYEMYVFVEGERIAQELDKSRVKLKLLESFGLDDIPEHDVPITLNDGNVIHIPPNVSYQDLLQIEELKNTSAEEFQRRETIQPDDVPSISVEEAIALAAQQEEQEES